MKKLVALSWVMLAVLYYGTAHAAIVEKTVALSWPADKPDSAAVIFKGLDLETGATVDEPKFDAPSWAVRLKQGYAGTNRGAVAILENSSYESVIEAPTQNSAYVADTQYNPAGPAPTDTYNENLLRWGDYYFFEGHLFAPYPHVFVVKTKDGHYAKVQFVDYVKEGQAICAVKDKDFRGRDRVKNRATTVSKNDGLVRITLRFSYNTEAGSRVLGEMPAQAPEVRQQPNISCPRY